MSFPSIAERQRRQQAARERRWHTIYKCFAADGTLLYVGISANRLARCSQHRKRQWWRKVARIDLEHVKGRAAAEARETEIIQTQNPKHNVRDRIDPAREADTFDRRVYEVLRLSEPVTRQVNTIAGSVGEPDDEVIAALHRLLERGLVFRRGLTRWGCRP
jgi:predicted GIY-YIG superfamily endonuclease